MDYLAENYTIFLPSIIIFISFLVASFICAKFLGPFLAGFAERWNHPCIAEGLKVFLKPSSYCLIALGALLAVSSLPPFMVEHFPWLSATGKAAGIACVVFFLPHLEQPGGKPLRGGLPPPRQRPAKR